LSFEGPTLAVWAGDVANSKNSNHTGETGTRVNGRCGSGPAHAPPWVARARHPNTGRCSVALAIDANGTRAVTAILSHQCCILVGEDLNDRCLRSKVRRHEVELSKRNIFGNVISTVSMMVEPAAKAEGVPSTHRNISFLIM
jgi:hypothetical protein